MLKILSAAALVAALGSCAHAPAFAGPLSDWYRSLRQPITGIGCCSEADCAEARAWRGPSGADDDWLVEIAGVRTPVPPELILHDKEHQGGSAVVCIVHGRVFCFVPPGGAG